MVHIKVNDYEYWDVDSPFPIVKAIARHYCMEYPYNSDNEPSKFMEHLRALGVPCELITHDSDLEHIDLNRIVRMLEDAEELKWLKKRTDEIIDSPHPGD